MRTNKRKRGLALPDVQIDVCPESAGLILSVGLVSIWLTERTAKQVVAELTSALVGTRASGADESHAAKTGESN
jgi:hypothetical protein